MVGKSHAVTGRMKRRRYLPTAITDVSRPEWATIAALIACECIVFYWQLAEQIVSFYPANSDQTSYMLNTYALLEAFRAQGWTALVMPIIHPHSASEATFTLQGALLSILGGANRTSMLSVNLVYFIALQLTLYCTVRALTRSIELAWIALALLLSLATTYYFAGGLYDYRIDFSAMCLYGIWACLILASRGLRSMGSALLIGAVGALLVSMRFFTILYVGAVIAGLFIAAVLGAGLAASPVRRRLAVVRARHLLVCGALTLAIAGPILFGARWYIYDYYGIGHLLGPEKDIRAAEQGLHSILGHLLFYPRNILARHLGPLTLALAGVVIAFSLLSAIRGGRTWSRRVLARLRYRRFEFATLALAISGPVAFLTADVSKSAIVGGIVVVPVILVIVLVASTMWPRGPARTFADAAVAVASGDLPPTKFGRRAWALAPGRRLAVLTFVAAFAGYLYQATADQRRASRLDLERINMINDAIARYAYESRLPQTMFSIDRVLDYLNAGTIQLYAYERYRRLLPLSAGLGHGGHGIFATPRETALKLVMDSDIVVLTDPVRGRQSPYPINVAIREYWDELWTWVDQDYVELVSTEIAGIPHHVFVRPLVKTAPPN